MTKEPEYVLEQYGVAAAGCAKECSTKELIRQQHLINTSFHPFLTETKSQSLKKDLTNLNYTINPIQSKAYSFQIESENAALGALYVSEGSVLGGLVIGKHLANCPALSQITKHYFFGNKPPIILNRWKQFREAIEAYEPTITDREKVLESAIGTFQLFGQIINDQLTA